MIDTTYVDPVDPRFMVKFSFPDDVDIHTRMDAFRRCVENMAHGVLLRVPPRTWGNHRVPVNRS